MEKRRKTSRSRRARASAKDVLAPANSESARVRPKWREHQAALLSARTRIAERKGVLVRDASQERPAFSSHMADAATDTYDRDFALGIASSEQNALYEIDQALNRIRDGSYGICEVTGKRIEPERLKAIPWTRFSSAAEKQLEQEGAVKRAKLGPLSEVAKGGEPSQEEEEEEE